VSKKGKAEPLAEFSASVVMRHFVWETKYESIDLVSRKFQSR
jgi:hypothetical protein